MKTHIPYKETKQFSDLAIDYQENNKGLKDFINYFPNIDNFQKQIQQKSKHFINREILVSVLEEQNSNIHLTASSKNNIKLLKSENTYTITTGHQLCLFTGPLLFFYKIMSAINLTEQLQKKYSNYNFVPVFWMATEDHDFQEINSINLFGEKLVWESQQSGPVGSMNLKGLEKVLIRMDSILGNSNNANELMNLFRSAYIDHDNLADATRYLINVLFGEYGLLIIDGNEKRLKKEFLPQIEKDVYHKGFVDVIRSSSNEIAKKYHVQAFVRDINFFDLSNNNRVLIRDSNNVSNLSVENFSPNVLMRTIYQESILPNIGVIGGPSEIAYWLQLYNAFQQENIPYPIIVHRNSVLMLRQSQLNKIKSFSFDIKDFFNDLDFLHKKYLFNKDSSIISLSDERGLIRKIYSTILKKNDDIGLNENINAELKKQLNVLDKIELRLIRSAKKRNSIDIKQISKIKMQLFPNNILQERYDNFIPFYLDSGENFIKILKNNLNPLDPNFVVLSY